MTYTRQALDKAHETLDKRRNKRLEASHKDLQVRGSSGGTSSPIKLGEARVKGARREGDGHIIHVRYSDTVKDPRGTVEGILREVGLITSNEEAEAYGKALDEYLDRNKAANAKNREKKKKKVEKEKGGGGGSGHTYSLADYGLDEEEVQREFKSYTDKYRLRE